MKLFLSSISINEQLKPYFLELVGKEAKDIKFALIENAADPYTEEVKGFMYKTRTDLEALGMQLERIDLNEYEGKQQELKDKLSQFDVVWVGGGNTYYVRWLFKKTGFDQFIHELVNNGLIYAGGSAGAIVAGPTLEKFQEVDEPENSPELINEGLGLIELVIIPHWGQEKYQENLQEIKKFYDKTNYKTVTLTDNQAVTVNGSDWKVRP